MTTCLPRWFACLVLVLPIVPLVAADPEAGIAPLGSDKFTVRCLNRDSVVKYEAGGKLNLKLEVMATLDQDRQLKPGDFRLALLDSQLRQMDGITIVISEDWKTKKFKKGENKDILTVQVPAPGEFEEGREYCLAVILTDRGADGVFPVWLRLVKFKVGKTAH